MSYEIRIRLIVENPNPGELSFARVERSLGLGTPARKWKVGDRLDERSDRIRRNDGMLYRFFEGSNCDPVEEASRLINVLESSGDAARRVLRENTGELSIVVRIYTGGDDTPMDVPPFHIPSELIGRLHNFALALDVDLYVFATDHGRTFK